MQVLYKTCFNNGILLSSVNLPYHGGKVWRIHYF